MKRKTTRPLVLILAVLLFSQTAIADVINSNTVKQNQLEKTNTKTIPETKTEYSDRIIIDSGLINDVGVSGVNSPSNQIFIGNPIIAPKATIQNFGSANQLTSFNITFTITGPQNYSSTKSDTLSAGQSRQITFDSTFYPTDTGIYSIKAWTSLVSDENMNNDTITSSFIISQMRI